MTFDEWKQKNYKQWNTEQAYMIASQGTPEEENAIDRYSKMIWEASQPKWTYCKDGMPDTEGNYLWLHADKSIHLEHYWTNLTLMPYVIAWMSLPEAPAEIERLKARAQEEHKTISRFILDDF